MVESVFPKFFLPKSLFRVQNKGTSLYFCYISHFFAVQLEAVAWHAHILIATKAASISRPGNRPEGVEEAVTASGRRAGTSGIGQGTAAHVQYLTDFAISSCIEAFNRSPRT